MLLLGRKKGESVMLTKGNMKYLLMIVLLCAFSQARAADVQSFYTGNQFPEEYRGDFFVAYHGSWNRSKPTGYKVVRVKVEDGIPTLIEPFLTGFLPEGSSNIGRPVDLLVDLDGSLLVSDDAKGRIFRVRHVGD